MTSFVPGISASFTSYNVKIIYIVLAWILYPLHCSMLPLFKKPKYSLLNYCLCCFNLCSPRLSLAEVYYILLMFSQALIMSSSVKISINTNLFVTSFCYSFLTSSSFIFLRLNLSQSNFCVSCLLTAKFYLTFQPPDRDQFHNQVP
jgi:hypothetical protein